MYGTHQGLGDEGTNTAAVHIYVCAEGMVHNIFTKFTKINAREKKTPAIRCRLIPLALAWSPESELDIHSAPSPSSGVEGGRLLEYTNRSLDSCMHMFSQTQRKVSHTHTHTHLPLLPLILLHSSSSSSSSCAQCLV